MARSSKRAGRTLGQVRRSVIEGLEVRRLLADAGELVGTAQLLGGMSKPYTVVDSISSSTDVDLFKFTVTREQRVSFDVDSTGSLNSYLRLFDSSGNPLGSNNDNAAGPGETNNSRDPYLERTFATGGTYYVGISSSANLNYSVKTGAGDTGGGTTGAYTLAVKSSLSTDNAVGTLGHFDIQRFGAFPGALDASKRTWVIVHGLNSNRAAMSTLAQAVQSEEPSDQVLTLDWSASADAVTQSGWSPGDPGLAELWIPTVAQWAQTALTNYGFSSGNLNLMGHSFGSYVCAELAENKVGGVNTIVGLDPASDVVGGYPSTTSANFSAYSQFSWAFHSSNSFGSETTPTTADEAFVVSIGSTSPTENHTKVVDLFANMLNASDAISQRFTLNRLLTHTKGPWLPNQFDQLGAHVSWGKYEGLLIAKFKVYPDILAYYPSSGGSLVTERSSVTTTGTISGTVFNDADGDGQKDQAEVALPGWTVYLDKNDNKLLDSGEPQTVTDSIGFYTFTQLTAADYLVRVKLQTGYQQTLPAGGYGIHRTLSAGQESLNNDFGVRASSQSPSISGVSPNPVTGSNVAQPFTVNGSNFLPGCTVTLRDLTSGQTFTNRTISQQTTTKLVINPVFTTAAHTWSVEVINPEGFSSKQYQFSVVISPGAPAVASVSPNPVAGSNVAQPFTINGSNFVSGCNVILRDLTAGQTFANRTISSFSSTKIVINPNFTTAAHSWGVEVINPDGKSTGQFKFSVVAPPTVAPTISSVSPNPVTGSNVAQPFTINGSNFASGCNVTLRDLTAGQVFANRTVSSFSSTKIVINPNFTTAAHGWSVEIINPDGKTSGQFKFNVTAPPSVAPSISSVSPNPVTGSNVAQPFTINGSNFVTGCNVTLRDISAGQTFANRTISSFSSTKIVINPNFTTAAHSWTVEIINPDGKTSGQISFSVVAPPSVTPTISSVSPNPVSGSNTAQSFTINGSNFVSGCNVTLRDLTAGQTFANRTISSFASTKIVINPNFTTAAHLWSVEVINPDGKSSGQTQFNVIAPPSLSPTISSVSPNPVTGSDIAQPFTISGSNFVNGCNVTLHDLAAGQTFANRTISSFSSSQITINPNFTTAAHSWSVEIINPDGKSSGQFQFNVVAPPSVAPQISSVNPNPVTGSDTSQPFTIYGSNFTAGCNVTLRDLTAGQSFSNRTISSFSNSQITINPNFTTAAHLWSVEVINPDGKSSGQYQFNVAAPPTLSPSINSVSPSPVTGSNSAQPFTIFGSNFVSGCNVTLRDLSAGQTFSNRTISSFSSSQITINPNFTTAAHSWSVEIINPDGKSSGQFGFSVIAPPSLSPTISSLSPNPVTGSNVAQPFTIFGSNFVSGCNVTLRDVTAGQTFANRAISFFSSTQITINPNFTTAVHLWSVEIINPDGKSTGQVFFNVQ